GNDLAVSERRPQEEGRDRWADTALAAAEDVIYVGIAALLVVAAGVLLAVAGNELLDVLDDFGSNPVVEVLDTLLLLFIVVELLSAVRTTVAKRELVAEPFLLVGIIASIKEIVVLSVKAAEDIGKGPTFSDQLWEIGVLGAVVLLLGATAWLLRLKEREPAEGERVADV
ncbi:MAG TPA: phosphate-starvation-inducible PsiE family protein, partial [Ilumatobacteraceae bacterium]|nr:phosphate-starvation-inducible PsiE family protein [Ilumatobacteraceae bacterium]